MTPQSRMAPKVELGVRSDPISIVGNGVHGAVPAQVVMVEHLGGSSLLYVQVDGLDQLLPWERQTNRGIAPARPVETWRSEYSPGVAAERPLLGRCEVASKADLRRNPVVRNNRPTDSATRHWCRGGREPPRRRSFRKGLKVCCLSRLPERAASAICGCLTNRSCRPLF